MTLTQPIGMSEPESPPQGDGNGRVTPVMEQYIEIKAANPDCLLFYRMGDFYELFFEDAETASRALGIVLTKRGKHHGADIPMCGVPVIRADEYLHRLIALGHRVAVCEQLEDPAEARKRGNKSVVRRDVIRLVTPGTLTEDTLLDAKRNNYLLAVARARLSSAGEDARFALAWIDISTGEFRITECDRLSLPAEIARLEPSEIIVSDALFADADLSALLARADRRDAAHPRRVRQRQRRAAADVVLFGSDQRSLRRADAAGTHRRRGLRHLRRAHADRQAPAAVAAFARKRRRHHGDRPGHPRQSRTDAHALRRAARLAVGGDRPHRHLGRLAPAGATTVGAAHRSRRRFKRGSTQWRAFVEDVAARADTRSRLAAAPDLARALARLAVGRGGPRDLAAIRDGVLAAADLARALAALKDIPAEIADALASCRRPDGMLAAELAAALAPELPALKRDGGFVREGYDASLDETRGLRDESRRVVAALQAQYAEQTGIRALKVRHNNVLGYFVEVTAQHGDKLLAAPLNSTFIHRQTLAGQVRFTTTELGELEAKIASAADRALGLELDIFERLVVSVMAQTAPIKECAEALARLDVASALGALAAERDYARPHVDDSHDFVIAGGRHPVVEQALARDGTPFVANDCDLSPPKDGEAGRIWLITGPNMAGKSTFLRQNALIAILAQMGSFVPAKAARIGVVDRLFSRVGAADDLARGRSTFMVEMVETAAILNQAGARSLVILDEIGRGTATFDGLSIAWATVEHLHDVNKCRALFATHFHELTALSARLDRLHNATVKVKEWKGDVVFLHEVIAGSADHSYGIQVAKLAGLPASVIERARLVLAKLEQEDRAKPKGFEDLPLFAAPYKPPQQMQDDAYELVLAAVAALNPDELSPREAMEALYALKQKLAETEKG